MCDLENGDYFVSRDVMFSEDDFPYAEASATNTTKDVLRTSPLEPIEPTKNEVVDAREDDLLAEIGRAWGRERG